MPYLEQQALYDSLGVETQLFTPPPAAQLPPWPATPNPGLTQPWSNTQIPLSVFMCPSDGGTVLNSLKGSHAKSNYRGITGSQSESPSTYAQATSRNGVFYVNSNTAVSDITDGSSNTLMVGECSLSNSNPVRVAALWAGMRGSVYDAEAMGPATVTTYDSDTMWMISSDPNWCINGLAAQAFSSSHPGGATFLFADGSVHFLAQNINGVTLECLAARNDGQPVGPF